MNAFWHFMNQTIVPVSICVVLPVLITWLVTRARTNKINKSSEIILKAIETNTSINPIDAGKLIEALGTNSSTKSPTQVAQKRLLIGAIFSFIGLAALPLAYTVFNIDGRNGQYFAFFILVIAGIALSVGLGFLLVYFLSPKK